jgi:hypothetical protein
VAALAVGVLDVVVHQGEVVGKLQGSGGCQALAPVTAQGLAGPEAKAGAQGLASGGVGRMALGVLPTEMVAHHVVKEGWTAFAQDIAQEGVEIGVVAGEDRGRLHPIGPRAG